MFYTRIYTQCTAITLHSHYNLHTPNTQFVDPEEEAAARLAKRRAKERKLQLAEETFGRVGAMQLASEDDDKSESNDSQSVTSVERDRIYGTGHIDHNSMSGVITQSIRTEILPLESTHPLVLRRDNDKTYNTRRT